MSTDPRRIKAKELSLKQGLTQAAIAQKLGVSTRTVERWASQDGWGARRTAQQAKKVISIASKPKHPEGHTSPHRRERRTIDELETVEGAICSLALLIDFSNDHDHQIDTRGIGGIASALVRLLEYRRKISPPTAAALADQVIELGISPSEFVGELKQKWQLQQRA